MSSYYMPWDYFGMFVYYFSVRFSGYSRFYFILFFLIYSCSITVVPIFPPYYSLPYSLPTFHIQTSPPPGEFFHGSLIHVPWPNPSPSIPRFPPLHPLWSLSVLYFHVSGSIPLTVMSIRFHLQVRSYGICLHHLAYFT